MISSEAVLNVGREVAEAIRRVPSALNDLSGILQPFWGAPIPWPEITTACRARSGKACWDAVSSSLANAHSPCRIQPRRWQTRHFGPKFLFQTLADRTGCAKRSAADHVFVRSVRRLPPHLSLRNSHRSRVRINAGARSIGPPVLEAGGRGSSAALFYLGRQSHEGSKMGFAIGIIFLPAKFWAAARASPRPLGCTPVLSAPCTGVAMAWRIEDSSLPDRSQRRESRLRWRCQIPRAER